MPAVPSVTSYSSHAWREPTLAVVVRCVTIADENSTTLLYVQPPPPSASAVPMHVASVASTATAAHASMSVAAQAEPSHVHAGTW